MTYIIVALVLYTIVSIPVIVWLSGIARRQHMIHLQHDAELRGMLETIKHERQRRVIAEAKCRGMVEVFEAAGVIVPAQGEETPV